jgi:hypothetical protein
MKRYRKYRGRSFSRRVWMIEEDVRESNSEVWMILEFESHCFPHIV